MAEASLLEMVRNELDYDPETGIFTWKISKKGVTIGARAGRVCHDGYRQITIGQRMYPEHRIAWLYVHGEFPPEMLDHRDGDRANNALSNLRPASAFENNWNARQHARSTSPFKGVTYVKRSGKWQAQIQADGRKYHLGLFSTPEAAREAYVEAAQRLHREFARVA